MVSADTANMQEDRLTENRVYTSIVLWVVGDLCVFPEHDLASRCHHTQLGDVDFYDCAFRHYTQLSVHRRLRVFLDSKDLQLECRF